MAITLKPIDSVAYSAISFDDLYEALGLHGDAATLCVVPDKGNEWEVSGVASPVTVGADGAWAFVNGKLVKGSADENIVIPTPSANPRIDRVVIEVDYTASPVVADVVRVAGSEAASPTPPALTQTDGTTWQIYLAQVLITTGGVITVTDERGFLGDGQTEGRALDSSVADNSTLELSGTTLQVKNAGIDEDAIAASIAGDGLEGGAGTALAVKVDDSTIEIVGDTLQVKNAGVPDQRIVGEIMANSEAALGGTDGRRMVVGGTAYEAWVNCDGGAAVNGVTIPDIEDRVIGGASASHAADATGGADTIDIEHGHTKGTLAVQSHVHYVNIASGTPNYSGIPGPEILGGGDKHTHNVQGNSNSTQPALSGTTADMLSATQDVRQKTIYLYTFIYVG